MPTLATFLPGPEPLTGDEVLERFLSWVADLGLTLYPAQEEAILELFAGRHLVLSTPTGSGKSLVATALHFKAMCEGQRSIYTAPIKALVNEKFFALCNDFGAEHVGMQTGDASINADAPIVCCTAEVLANMALRRGDELAAPYVIMDEFHYYGDRERGIAWQIPLLCLPATTFLLMSATFGVAVNIPLRTVLFSRLSKPQAAAPPPGTGAPPSGWRTLRHDARRRMLPSNAVKGPMTGTAVAGRNGERRNAGERIMAFDKPAFML